MVRRKALVLFVAVLAAAAGCGGSSSGGQPPASAGPPQHPSALAGVVGKNDAFSISLSDDAGNAITNLVAGTYKLTVHDDSSLHNFHITGSGVDEKTEVQKSQVKTFSITVKQGTYTFLCDNHPTQMKGSFRVS